MSESDFDLFARKTYEEAVQRDPFLPTPDGFFDNGPPWREISGPPPVSNIPGGWRRVNDGKMPIEPKWSITPGRSGVHVRLPYGEVSLEILNGEVRILENGVMRRRAEYELITGDNLSLTSSQVDGGVLYQATVQHVDEDEPTVIAAWFNADVVAHRPWWRRWLDRAWPARAR